MKNEFQLDFEKPLAELAGRVEELRRAAATGSFNLARELQTVSDQLEAQKVAVYGNLTAWQRVQLARHPMRPYMLDFVKLLFTDFLELAGDRRFSDDKAIVGGFAKLRGKTPVMVIGTQKGRDTKSNMLRNFGWPGAEGYRKAMRLMRLAERAGLPIITFIDTPGAYPGIASEERHVGEAIAANLRDMFSLRVPVIAVVTGEGGSGGAIGLGVGNRLLIMENAYYSVITPEGCAAILWKDRKYAEKASEALQLTADKLLELGIADEIVKEPFSGAQSDYEAAAAALGDALESNLKQLARLSVEKLREQRYGKFRRIGVFVEEAQ